MNDKLAIIVPYRDREEQLNTFVPHMHEFLKDKGVEYDIFIAEQSDDRPFNYGKLCNSVVKELDEEYNYFCFHDIDMLPVSDDCDYGFPETPIHLATNVEVHDNKLPYPQYFGGVVLINREDFEKANGYSPEYYGYGFVDLDLLYRLEKSGAYLEKFHDLNKTYETFDEDDVLPYRIENVKIAKSKKVHKSNVLQLKRNSRIYGVMNKFTSDSTKPPFFISLWFKDTDDSKKNKNLFSFEGNDTGIFLSNGRYVIGQVWDDKETHTEILLPYFKKTWNHAVFAIQDDKIILYLNNKKIESKLKDNFKIFDYKNHCIKISDKNTDITISSILVFNSKTNSNIVKDLYYNGLQNLDTLVNTNGLDLSNFYMFDKLYRQRIILDNGTSLNHLKVEGNVEVTTEEINLSSEIYLPMREDGKYESLSHERDDEIIERYYEYDPDVEENADIFFNEVLTNELDYKNIGLSNLKYKIMDTQDRKEYKLIRILT
jgi:hypothetical protein